MIPERLYLATVRGNPDVVLYKHSDGYWASVEHIKGSWTNPSTVVADLRPAVVLDLEAVTSHLDGDLDARVWDLCARLRLSGSGAVRLVADAIEAQYQPQPTVPQVIRKQLAGQALTAAERDLLATHADSLENGGDHD